MPSDPWVNGLKLSPHSVQRPRRPEAQLRPEIREVIGDGKAGIGNFVGRIQQAD